MIVVEDFFKKAYEGCYYTITGCGGDLEEWIEGYEKMLQKEGIGKPVEWYTFTGKDMNEHYNLVGSNAYPEELVFLAFPLDDLDEWKLAIFKLTKGDRWFNDIVDNNERNN